MLMAMIENIYETMNLRITETAFELHLRKIYPTRNIVSMRETETISGQDCLDVQKKTDGSVNIIGEVATDPVASWMIQSAQVASKFTLFTHHAKTFPNLVTALRNSMLRTGVFKDEKTAEEQVVQVLNFDIHLIKDFRGRRYIERITECIPVEEKNEYTFDHRKEKTLEGKFDKFFDNATIFFTKQTNRELYKYRNVLEFVDDSYVLTNPISDENIRGMRENMNDTDVEEFDAFLERNWGIKPPKLVAYDENGKEIKSESAVAAEESAKKEAFKASEMNKAKTSDNANASSDGSSRENRPQMKATATATSGSSAGANSSSGAVRPEQRPHIQKTNMAGQNRPVMKKRPILDRNQNVKPQNASGNNVQRKPTELKNFDLDEEE